MHISILIRSSFCLLSFRLHICRPNFVELARTTQMVDQARCIAHFTSHHSPDLFIRKNSWLIVAVAAAAAEDLY